MGAGQRLFQAVPRPRSALADDERGLADDMARLAGVAGYCEQLGCRATDLVRVLGNDRELRAAEQADAADEARRSCR